MPIARIMNMPDGSTPVPPVGGGDVNGTIATSILGSQAGTNGSALSMERHQHFQTSTLGLPGGIAPLNAMALDELEETTQLEDSAKAELAEARQEEKQEEVEAAEEEVEEWLAENRAITAPPEPEEPEPPKPRQRPPRHR